MLGRIVVTPLIHVKGYAAPETRVAAERAHLYWARPCATLLLFSVLYGFWVANYVAFNRAINDACKLAGTASVADGMIAT
jgi:hypothetical protein